MCWNGTLRAIRGLDPACGSGNFLYVTLRLLKDREREILVECRHRGLNEFDLSVGPHQLFGIEINPYAFDLAQMTIWIGFIQWQRDNGIPIDRFSRERRFSMSATLRTEKPRKGYKGLGMEGAIARWYSGNTGKGIEEFRKLALSLAGQLEAGSSVLEVAPGPGYLAIELAKLGRFQVVGLDISKTFVAMAAAKARDAGVQVEFQLGNASAMPFDSHSFDLIVCRAAFKNFAEPEGALTEMHRVLKSGGKALILDLRPDASPADIAAAVDGMNLGWLNSLMTRLILRWLRRRAHSKETFRQMAAQTPFKTCAFQDDSIGMEITLKK